MDNKKVQAVCVDVIRIIVLGLFLLGLLMWITIDSENICESFNDIVEPEVKYVLFSGCFMKTENGYWTQIMTDEAMFGHLPERE